MLKECVSSIPVTPEVSHKLNEPESPDIYSCNPENVYLYS